MHCILPKEWKGIHFGGLEKIVVYFDLDCRFDVLRLSNALRIRIMDSYGELNNHFSEFHPLVLVSCAYILCEVA